MRPHTALLTRWCLTVWCALWAALASAQETTTPAPVLTDPVPAATETAPAPQPPLSPTTPPPVTPAPVVPVSPPTTPAPAPVAPAPALPYGKDLRVPGSKVSVRLEKDARTGGNGSSLFIDEQYDTLGKTFVQFRCRPDRKLAFFIKAKVPLLTEQDINAGRAPTISYRVDGQQPRTFPGVLTRKNGDFDRFALAVSDTNDARFLAAFKAATRKVELTLARIGAPALKLSFPVKGMKDALNVVEGCAALP